MEETCRFSSEQSNSTNWRERRKRRKRSECSIMMFFGFGETRSRSRRFLRRHSMECFRRERSGSPRGKGTRAVRTVQRGETRAEETVRRRKRRESRHCNRSTQPSKGGEEKNFTSIRHRSADDQRDKVFPADLRRSSRRRGMSIEPSFRRREEEEEAPWFPTKRRER